MRFLLLSALLLTPTVALADGVPPPATTVIPSTALTPVPPGEDRIVPLRKGEPAPFDGQLFDTNTAIRWGNFLEQAKVRLKIDVELMQKIMAAEIGYRDKVIQYEQDKYLKVTTDLEAKVRKLEYEADHPPWYQSGWFTFAVGAAAMGAAIGLSAYAITSF